ncbi:MAG: nucleotide-binding universal stress UspA family protein [Sphingobacteriales bacterium]|jgi:nucleotide-binding universal stress UspA family protein
MEFKRILVPTDFSPIAEVAIDHAVHLAKVTKGEVILLHIINDGEDRGVSEEKIQKEKERFTVKFPDVSVSTLVRTGNIFEDIGDVAQEEHADVIFMGTHGAKGMQRIIGSHAMKVIKSTMTPFVISQDLGPRQGGFKNIVVPIDLSRQTNQKLGVTAKLAKHYGAKVHLLVPHEKDEFLKRDLKLNLKYADKYFQSKGVDHVAHVTEGDSGVFAKHIITYSEAIDADMISIMNISERGILKFIGASFEQDLITNKLRIPVMVLNPKSVTREVGAMSS